VKILLDTNCLLVVIPIASEFRWLYDAMKKGEFTLAVTTDILEEYEEQIASFYAPSVADNVLKLLLNLPNLEQVTVYFKWNLITADCKFVDCAVACNADYIVTHDRHFKILERIDFPKVKCLTISEFHQLLYADIID
jgi:uncharacterized protein